MKKALSLIALAGLAGIANAQAYPVEAQLCFQVWNGSTWASTVTAAPGQTVQIRAVVSYTGPRTDLFAMGEILYQPIIGNADNTGPTTDAIGTWRNNGDSGNNLAGSMLDASEGDNGGALASYGRVRFGATGMTQSGGNRKTTHRHGGDNAVNGAPAGSWIRLAGNTVTNWPASALPTAPSASAAAINNIKRGISANQLAKEGATGTNTFHVAGTQNLVIFRQAITLGDSTDTRTITSLSSFLNRDGGANNADDDRFMTWQTSQFDNGGYKTGVEFKSASIVIPSPASAALLGLGGLVAARRRRA